MRRLKMKVSRKKIYLLVSVVVMLAMCLTMFSGCTGNSSNSSSGSTDGEDVIKIGLLIEQSGASETWGTQEQRGWELGFQYATNKTMEIDGKKVKLIIEDTSTAVDVAVQKATKLLETDKVDIIAGSTNSSIALAVMEIAKQRQVPYVVACAAADSITGSNFNEYTFQIGRTLRQVSRAASDYLPKLGKTFALLYPDYAGGIDFANSWAQDIKATGGQVIYQEYAPLDSTDFTPWLKSIKDTNPDVLVIGLIGNSFSVKLPQQLKEMSMLDSMEVIGDFADREFYKGIGSAGVGMVGTTMYYHSLYDTPENNWLVENHQSTYKELPDLWTGNSFSAAIAVTEAIKKAGSMDSSNIISALEGLTFNGTTGQMTIRKEDHVTLQNMAVVELKDLGGAHPEPTLIELVDSEGCAPPITAPGRG